jgi:tetratricopeptide (TPR) repeat protein
MRSVAVTKGPEEVLRAAAAFQDALPSNSEGASYASRAAWAAGRFDSAMTLLTETQARGASESARAGQLLTVARQLGARGRLRDARRLRTEASAAYERDGRAGSLLSGMAQDAFQRAFVLGDKAGAVTQLDAAVQASPPAKLPNEQVLAVSQVAFSYAAAGRPDRARAMLAIWDKLQANSTEKDDIMRRRMLAEIALAEGKPAEALAQLRDADIGICVHCVPVAVARTHDLMGQTDSAIASFEQYLRVPTIDRGPEDESYLAGAHKRLGELYEAKGEKSKALSHYLTFVELWKNADPELQPRVTEVRAAIKRVRDTEGAR